MRLDWQFNVRSNRSGRRYYANTQRRQGRNRSYWPRYPSHRQTHGKSFGIWFDESWTEPPSRTIDLGPLEEETGYHTVVSNVDVDVKDEVEANRQRYPGVRIFVRTRRIYPQEELASHLIGTRTPMTAAELAKRREADPSAPSLEHGLGDPIGRSGLELQYESHLHGVRGQRRLVKNRRGEIVNEEVVLAPQHGRDPGPHEVHAEVQRRGTTAG